MKKILLPACALGLMVAGCAMTDTVSNRIAKNQAIYAGLTPEEQNQIKSGIITVGFTPEMVLMALGKPERILPGKGPGEEDWVYVNVYSRDGYSIGMSAKVTHTSFGGAKRGSGSSFSAGNTIPEFNLDYDPSNEKIRAESAIKVHVKFTEGTVADIQIISDGKG
ncbi:MAG: hypothetical protein JSS11_13430 [Verrucomicrobia bacterium]|nr:hypothetical protein [Verrucomicrobiota bacterium]